MKRIVAMVLVVLLCFTSGGEILAAGLSNTSSNITKKHESTMKTGLMQPEMIEISEDEIPEKVYSCEEILTSNKYSAVYNHDWDKYSTNYYYNSLSQEKKELWDAMDAMCLYYLNNNVDIMYGTMDAIYVSSDILAEDVGILFQMFIYSNPQYYFLLNSLSYSRNLATGMVKVIMLNCYEAFAKGTDRAVATQKVQAQINEWEAIVAQYPTDEEKLQVIYELVCDKVTYNYDFVDGLVSEEECFSQSAYSVFCTDTTVCAGYADAMTVMCNAVGLDAVSVTSWNHQWNKVRINDNWYNYDATWGDGDSKGNNYIYYARSDAFYAKSGNSHIEEAMWKDFSPNAVIDVEPAGYYKPGIYPEIENMTQMPSISISYDSAGYILSFTCATENAVIYYTLDGTEPSPARTKSFKYTGQPVLLDKTCEIKAIAVCDGYLDSYEQGASVVVNEYMISYVLNGGTNDSRNPSTFKEIGPVVELYPATREGYSFGGWYFDSAFTSPVVKLSGSIGNVTVYAKWNKLTESIENAKVTLSKNKYNYDGKSKKPTITVIFNGKTLVKGTDYKVNYKNNKNIGKATVTITGINDYKGTITKKFTISEKKGVAFTSGKYQYKVTGSGVVAFHGIVSKKATKVTIPKTVKYGGKTFKVTSVADKALKGKTKVTQVTIGENVTKIGASAFYGCKKLKTITIKSTKLKTVGKDALKKINAKATIKVPKSKLKKYQSLLKNKGHGSKVKIVKMK